MRVNFDVLLILDALDKYGSFAAAAESLFKTPAALSYMVQKLESDLNISILDRSGHRARFTDTGRMVLEQGRYLLDAARTLEKQALQMASGWEKELNIVLDGCFPFELLLPIIDEFYQLAPQTRLRFSQQTLAGSWEALTTHNGDIILGALNEPPGSAAYGYKPLGRLENVFVVAPHHPLATAQEPLSNQTLAKHRAAVILDSARQCPSLNINFLEEQDRILVDSFATKIALLKSGQGCGFLPRHIARPGLDDGSLVEKTVDSFRQYDQVYMAWRTGADGLGCHWWQDKLLASPAILSLYRQ